MSIAVVSAGYVGSAVMVTYSYERESYAPAPDPRIGSRYKERRFGYRRYYLPEDTKQLLVNYD